jgi:hypothetical protein
MRPYEIEPSMNLIPIKGIGTTFQVILHMHSLHDEETCIIEKEEE